MFLSVEVGAAIRAGLIILPPRGPGESHGKFPLSFTEMDIISGIACIRRPRAAVIVLKIANSHGIRLGRSVDDD
jgi:hypothetical protein